MSAAGRPTEDYVLVEELSKAAHEAWMATKRQQGIEARQSEWGEELMVSYADLSEQAKDLDRGTVRGVLAAADQAGYVVVPVQMVSELRAVAARAYFGSGPRTKERQLAVTVQGVIERCLPNLDKPAPHTEPSTGGTA